jgi:hypothetical protein
LSYFSGAAVALYRYRIVRGKRPPGDPLPSGERQDTRKHTRHVLRPPAEAVVRYLDDPTDDAWEDLRRSYLDLLEQRFLENREPFDELAALAGEKDVYLGCNCPTKINPVERCHTVLALKFMKRRYPGLEVVFPGPSGHSGAAST